MPSKRFASAVKKLSVEDAAAVLSQLAAWKAETLPSPWPQIAENIENETALAPIKFSKLLGEFASALQSSTASDAWREVCRRNKFQGSKLGSSEIPVVLGRLMKLDQLINLALPHSPFPRSFLEVLLNDSDGIDPAIVDPSLPDVLRFASLGRFLIWATFDKDHPDQSPFGIFPPEALDCCTMLGLAEPAGATCVLLHYEFGTYEDELPQLALHRPSAADAEDFPLYRPCRSRASSYGMTHPTAPNPKNLTGCPEIVHREISGKGLIFPYRLAV